MSLQKNLASKKKELLLHSELVKIEQLIRIKYLRNEKNISAFKQEKEK